MRALLLQWLVRTYGLWDEDLELVSRLIRIDVRNHSAWNEVRTRQPGAGAQLDTTCTFIPPSACFPSDAFPR